MPVIKELEGVDFPYVQKEPMNPEIKKLWVDALRSGEYKQGQGTLKRSDCFCCLGVLTDIFIKITGRAEWIPVAESHRARIISTDYAYQEESSAILLKAVCEWAGLKRPNPVMPIRLPTRNITTLSELNDLGRGFSEIADIIEKYL